MEAIQNIEIKTMKNKQLWSKCRLRAIYPQRVKLEIQLFMFSFWLFVETEMGFIVNF